MPLKNRSGGGGECLNEYLQLEEVPLHLLVPLEVVRHRRYVPRVPDLPIIGLLKVPLKLVQPGPQLPPLLLHVQVLLLRLAEVFHTELLHQHLVLLLHTHLRLHYVLGLGDHHRACGSTSGLNNHSDFVFFFLRLLTSVVAVPRGESE